MNAAVVLSPRSADGSSNDVSIGHDLTKIADRVFRSTRNSRRGPLLAAAQSSLTGSKRPRCRRLISEDPRARDSGTLLTRYFADNRFDKADIAIFYFQMRLMQIQSRRCVCVFCQTSGVRSASG